MDIERIAKTFMLRGIQHWGQTIPERISAAQAVIDAARFDATVTVYPFDKSSWAGEDATEAQLWLKGVMENMPTGKFEIEAGYIQRAIETRQQETVA